MSMMIATCRSLKTRQNWTLYDIHEKLVQLFILQNFHRDGKLQLMLENEHNTLEMKLVTLLRAALTLRLMK